MTENVNWVFELAINPGRLEDFKNLVAAMVEATRKNEVGALNYEWAISDGTTALPAARLGAEVLGVDIAKNLVEAGNKRAKEYGLTSCKFQEGDASNLHELEDQRFDLVGC